MREKTLFSISVGVVLLIIGVFAVVSAQSLQSEPVEVQGAEYDLQSAEYTVQGSDYQVQGSQYKVQ